MEIPSMIEVLRAHEAGEKIQARARAGELGHEKGWADVSPNWDFYRSDFRVKSEPREYWIWTDPENAQILNYKPVNQGFMHVREVIEQ